MAGVLSEMELKVSNSKKSPSLKDFDDRLRAAKERHKPAAPGKGGSIGAAGQGMGIGVRVAVEIVAAIAVGVGIGLGLDYEFGTKPWFLILFVLLGFGAGVTNVMRTAKELERKAKARKAAEAAGLSGNENES